MSITIGETEIKRGEKKKGFLKVGEASTHQVNMPYIVVNGSNPGPNLCVLGGVHPLEYASIEGVLKVAGSVQPEDLAGTLMLVPVVNPEGFNSRAAFNNPIDYVNQNRVFPGSQTGSMSRRAAHTLFQEFVSKADALIDSHGGVLTEDINRFVIIANTDREETHSKMVDMASCYDAHYIRVSNIAGSTMEALKLYGIPCITPESGTPYPVREEEINFHHDGVVNVMKHLKMLEGEPQKRKLKINPQQERLHAQRGGIWRQKVKAGQRVEEGTVLGEVVNLLGDKLQTVKAPFKEIANNSRTSCVVNSGDTLLYVVKV